MADQSPSGRFSLGLRAAAAVIVLIGFIAAAVLLSDPAEDPQGARLFLPTHTPEPTLEPSEEATAEAKSDEFSRRLIGALGTPGPNLFEHDQGIKIYHFTSHGEAEDRVGWRILRHPECQPVGVRVSYEGGRRASSVNESCSVAGQEFELRQEVPSFLGIEIIDESPRVTATVASFDVTFRRDDDNRVFAEFATGERIGGLAVAATVRGGEDVEAVRRFIDALTFAD